jgi:transposase-like protein
MLEMKPNNIDTQSASDLEGARRATGESLAGKASVPDPQVVAQSKRRRFTSKYKLSILEKADQCNSIGETGALLRREGLYSSHLSHWRKARRDGTLQALATHKRGPKNSPDAAQAREIAVLQKQVNKLQGELSKAHTIIDVQKKLSTILAVLPNDENES